MNILTELRTEYLEHKAYEENTYFHCRMEDSTFEDYLDSLHEEGIIFMDDTGLYHYSNQQ